MEKNKYGIVTARDIVKIDIQTDIFDEIWCKTVETDRKKRVGVFLGRWMMLGMGNRRRRNGGACRQAATEREKWG